MVAWSLGALSGCGGGGGGGGGAGDGAGEPPPGPAAPGPASGGGGGGIRSPACIATASHGCISKEEFDRLRDAGAALLLADSEFRPSRPDPRTLTQPALERLNVHRAHAALAVKYGANVKPGQGVTIGVLDSGVDLGHGELEDADITETFLQTLADERRTDFERGEFSHGTAVTSIMAAQRNDSGFIGIAWGATFKVYTVPIGAHLADDAPVRETFDWAAAYRSVLSGGADIVNASYSTDGSFVENYTAEEMRALDQRGDELAVVAQTGVANPAIFVWSAGNDHGAACEDGDENCVPVSPGSADYHHEATSPSREGGAVALLPELRGHNVVVVAVGEDGSIADFSNRCGVAGRWCIAAPGTGIRAAEFGSRSPPAGGSLVRRNIEGTSFASPMVSGGLALMKHFFRGQLSNRELVARLFATADKSGIYASDRTDGTSSIYGQGLLDLGAAVAPVDGVSFVPRQRAGTGEASVRGSRLRLGAAFGDGLSRSAAGREVAAFDALGAPFWFHLPAFVQRSYRPPSVAARHALAAPGMEEGAAVPDARGTGATPGPLAPAAERRGWRAGLHGPGPDAGSGLLHLAGNAATAAFHSPSGLEAAAFGTSSHRPGEGGVTGASLAWRPPDRPLGLRAGWLHEEDSVLGSTASGAFGRLSADSLFAGFEATADLGGWRLALDAEVGHVAAHARGGLIDGLSGLTTSAMSLQARRALTERDGLTVGVAQPLRVESGTARFALPAGRTLEGEVLRESFSADLAPSRRQVDLTAGWRRTGVLGGELRAAGAVSHDAGHADTKPRFSVLAQWRAEF